MLKTEFVKMQIHLTNRPCSIQNGACWLFSENQIRGNYFYDPIFHKVKESAV
jgi:hypothetical protein